jgi:hypothetical protein
MNPKKGDETKMDTHGNKKKYEKIKEKINKLPNNKNNECLKKYLEYNNHRINQNTLSISPCLFPLIS